MRALRRFTPTLVTVAFAVLAVASGKPKSSRSGGDGGSLASIPGTAIGASCDLRSKNFYCSEFDQGRSNFKTLCELRGEKSSWKEPGAACSSDSRVAQCVIRYDGVVETRYYYPSADGDKSSAATSGRMDCKDLGSRPGVSSTFADLSTAASSSSSARGSSDSAVSASCLAIVKNASCAEYSVAKKGFDSVCKIGSHGDYSVPGTACPTGKRIAQCVKTDETGMVETTYYYGNEYTNTRGKKHTWSLGELRSLCKNSGGLIDKGNTYVFKALSGA